MLGRSRSHQQHRRLCGSVDEIDFTELCRPPRAAAAAAVIGSRISHSRVPATQVISRQNRWSRRSWWRRVEVRGILGRGHDMGTLFCRTFAEDATELSKHEEQVHSRVEKFKKHTCTEHSYSKRTTYTLCQAEEKRVKPAAVSKYVDKICGQIKPIRLCCTSILYNQNGLLVLLYSYKGAEFRKRILFFCFETQRAAPSVE